MVLFYSNVDRNNFNKKRVEQGVAGVDFFVNKCEDEAKGLEAGCREAQRTLRLLSKAKEQETPTSSDLPSSLSLRTGCRYMVTINDDQRDGIVNGACGVLRKYVRGTEEGANGASKFATRMWLEFGDKRVGRKRRATKETERKRREDGVSGDGTQDWTPIERVRKTLRVAKKKKYVITRTQFAQVEAEALTIHKSQGATYDSVALDISQRSLDRSLFYVALSRCTRLSGLYLYGHRKSIMPPEMARLSANERHEMVLRNRENCEWRQEEERMRRDAPFVNRWPYLLQDNVGQPAPAGVGAAAGAAVVRPYDFEASYQVNFIFHNVRSFRKHAAKIAADRAFQRAQLIFLCETRTNPNMPRAQLHLPGYKLVVSTGSEAQSNACGQLVFVRDSMADRVKLMCTNRVQSTLAQQVNSMVELSLVKCFLTARLDSYVYLLFAYRHPSKQMCIFLAEVKDFLLQTKLIVQAGGSSLFGGHKYKFTHKTYFFGDFNLDFRHHKSDETILKLLSKYKLRMCFEPSETATTAGAAKKRGEDQEDDDDDDDDDEDEEEDDGGGNKVKANANVTTNYGSCLDMCLASTVEEDKDREHPVTEWACVYESYFSDHKPVWISVKQS